MTRRSLYASILCILLSGGVLAQAAAPPAPRPALTVPEAPGLPQPGAVAALDSPVTLSDPHVYLGELMADLSRKSGLSLRVQDDKYTSGIQLTVFVRRRPLRAVLTDLASILSFHASPWVWEQGAAAGEYWLMAPDLAARAALVSKWVQERFDAEATLMERAAAMTPAERARLAKDNPALAGEVQAADCLNAMQAFSGLPKDVQARVLSGEQGVRVPLSDMPPTVAAEFLAEWRSRDEVTFSASGSGPPTRDTPTQPSYVDFYRVMTPGSPYPNLAPQFGNLAAGCLGNREQAAAVEGTLADQWLQPGDRRSDPAEADRLPSDLRAEASQQAAHSPPGAERPDANEILLQRVAADTGLPVIALLPERNSAALASMTTQRGATSGPPWRTVGALLADDGAFETDVTHKWRQGALLLAYPAWFATVPDSAPYRLIRELRASARAGGLLRLDALRSAARSLSQAQLTLLGEAFPQLIQVATVQPLLRLMDTQTGITAAGLPLKELPELTPPGPLSAALGPAVAGHNANSVRLKLVPAPYATDGEQELELQVLDSAGGVVSRVGIVDCAPVR